MQRCLLALCVAAAGCGKARAPVLSNAVVPPCGEGEMSVGLRVPDSSYMCRLSIDDQSMPWFPCAAISSSEDRETSVIQDAGVTSHCTFSGIVTQLELEADVDCRVDRHRRVVGRSTTRLHAVAAGWEAATELGPAPGTIGSLDLDEEPHRVSLVVCRRPWPKTFP
ncbi:MAG: hypothetical protein KF773_14855 [Deltaproteobacteria bacterium]|nr:hypothetical protein [Deltaproteobacteria bacterium]MCW5804998.1 hypothetical protein [Deltaproteobacteria bacterium]